MLFNQTAALTAEERENPLQILQDLTGDYKLPELCELICVMVEVCLTTDNSDFTEPMQRSDLLTQGRHLLKTVEAGYLLAEQDARDKD